MKSILITGGAGFVGSHLARLYREAYPQARIVAFDNLHRRGSERNLPVFQRLGVEFVHGDIRNPEDLHSLSGNFDTLIEASAEPSVLAGHQAGSGSSSASYLIGTNLFGTHHVLDFARSRVGVFLFLSTSRVYSIAPLCQLPLVKGAARFEWDAAAAKASPVRGFSPAGISEEFEVLKPRSLYGATKLASELLIQEYAQNLGLSSAILRCGVIAGPGQFGKVDQGVFTLWVARHLQKRGLRYTGFGGQGHQVRDLLHPSDLFEALQKTQSHASKDAPTFNLGGGIEGSVSLQEFTRLCEEVTGNRIPIESAPDTHSVDIPYYVSDTRSALRSLGWKPSRSPRQIVQEISDWLRTIPLDELFA